MSQTLIDAIKQAQKEQNWQKVIELCDELHQQSPEKWESLWWAGHAHKNLCQYIQAEEWFTKLKTAFPNRHLGLEGWVNVAEHQQNWAEMSQRVDAFEAQYPDLWHVPFWRGMIAKNTQRFDEAERHYALLAQKRSDWHVGWEEPVKMAFQRGDYRRAIELNPTFQAAFPHLWQSYWWVGQSYKNLGLYDEAMAQFAQLKEKFPDNHRGWEGEINIAQHQQNWQRVVELATEFQAAFPHMWQGFWWAGHAHKSLYQYPQALLMFQNLITRFPTFHQGYEGVVNVYEHQNDWQAVLAHALIFRQHFPNLWHSYHWEAIAHMGDANYVAAMIAFSVMVEKFPDSERGMAGLIQVANHKNDWKMAWELSHAAIARFPDHIPFYVNLGHALIRLKRFDEAEAHFIEMEEKFPDSPIPLLALTPVYKPQRQHNKEIAVLEKAFQKFKHNQDVVKNLIQAYLNNNQPELAQEIYDKHLFSEDKGLLSYIHKLMWGNAHYLNEIEAIYRENPNNAHFANTYAAALVTYSMPNQGQRSPKQGLQIWEEWSSKYEKNQTFQNNTLNAYIRFGLHEQAMNMIAQLPNRQNSAYLRLKAWEAHQKGDINQERKYWHEILDKDFFAEMLLHKGQDLKQISQKAICIQSDDIILFAVQHNELLRLPDFLNHYRKLGVNVFIFVDNNSDDGSLAFLLAQDDCHVFSTDSSFNQAGSGIAWVNYLIHAYAHPNQWCIHADIDELLVYPHCETQSLQQLRDYLNEQNAELMSSFMLDMYPKNLAGQLAFRSGESMMEKAPYFYNEYHFYHKVDCPYIYPVGGILCHFDIPVYFTKTALFKVRPDFYFLCSTHASTPMKVADVSAAYLHFKMLGDFQAKATAEAQRKEHFAGGRAYSQYAQMYERYIHEDTDLSALDKSVRYENSQQLVDLGLIQTSDAWEEFVAQSQS